MDLSIFFTVSICSESGHEHLCLYLTFFLLTKCQRMDVFNFKVPPLEKKKRKPTEKTQQMSPVFKDKWLFRTPKGVCLKAVVCAYYSFLIRKIKANFLLVDQMLGGLTARWAPPEKFCSWDTFQRKVACQIKDIKIFWMTSCLIQNNQGLDPARSGKQKQ